MNFYLSLPLMFLQFWFIESPVKMLAFFSALNRAFSRFFSLNLFIRTFFKPWKNEYRKGLVGFSIAMSMFFKSIMILFDLSILVLLFGLELIFLAGFLLLPLLTVAVLFIGA